MDDFENPRVRRLRGLSPVHPDSCEPRTIDVSVRRIITGQTRQGTLPKRRVEEIAADKNVQVLWERPFVFEITHRDPDRGVLKFYALVGGREAPIFEVLDIHDIRML